MPIGSSKIGVLGAGLVPGGSVTFNASGTWDVPPGVKVVSITGVGGTGNPGVAGNPGNPGNPGTGGGGGGASVKLSPGNIGSDCNPSRANDQGNGNGGNAWRNDTCWITNNPVPNPVAPNTRSPGGKRQNVVNPSPTCATSGVAGISGNAGTAGNSGTAGNPGQASSGLCNTFPGGAGGNAPPGGSAGNGGSGGQGGGGTNNRLSGGSAGNGAGSGGSGANGAINFPETRIGGQGGGGAGSVNNGQSGRNDALFSNPLNNNTCVYGGFGNPSITGNADVFSTGIKTTSNSPLRPIVQNMVGGSGGSGYGSNDRVQGGPAFKVGGRPGSVNTLDWVGGEPQFPSSNWRRSFNQVSPAPLRPEGYRAGAGGGGTGTVVRGPLPCYGTGAGGGGGGRGNAGNAGGNSPTVSGSAGTPQTFNCVPVTPGGTAPITVASPGGQIVISWNPQ